MHADIGPKITPPVQQVLELYAAVRDSRINDVIALVHPRVSVKPLVRPGLTQYHGHEDMPAFVGYLHAAHGNYQIETDEITERPGPVVTVHATLLPERGRNQPPLSVTTVYTFREGLIASVESEPGS